MFLSTLLILAIYLLDKTITFERFSKFQIYTAETAYMHLESIILTSVTTTRVVREEEASKQRRSRDCR